MQISECPIHPWSHMMTYPPHEILDLPVAARILGVRCHKKYAYLIVSYENAPGTEPRRFRYLSNRDDFDPEALLYVGTVQFRNDSIHVFEDVRVRED